MSYNALRRALLATTAFAGLAASAAHAQDNVMINPGAQSVILGGGSSLAYPTYVLLYQAYSSGDSTIGWNWTAKGSGNSQCAFINNYENAFDSAIPAPPNNGGLGVDLAASDGFLSAAQIDIWQHGYSGTGLQAGTGPTCTATNEAATSNIPLTYPTTAPATQYGALIQLPTFGTPVTIAYNVDGIRAGNARVTLTDDQLCGIFSGAITTFGDPRMVGSGLQTASNAGTTIHPTYRADGSGTSFLFTQHLKGGKDSSGNPVTVCTAANSTPAFYANLQAIAPVTSFASLFTTGGGTVPSTFRNGPLSQGVVAALGFSPTGSTAAASGINGIAYLSPDFTEIASVNASRVFPYVAEVKNVRTGAFVEPSVGATIQALATAQPPTTATAGNPAAYIPSIPTPPAGYPIVGYTTIDLPQCYKDNNKGLGMIAYLTALYTASTSTLGPNGFAQLPSNFFSIISNNILSNSFTLPLNLDIENVNVCKADGSGTGTIVGR